MAISVGAGPPASDDVVVAGRCQAPGRVARYSFVTPRSDARFSAALRLVSTVVDAGVVIASGLAATA